MVVYDGVTDYYVSSAILRWCEKSVRDKFSVLHQSEPGKEFKPPVKERGKVT